jgi:two-component system sensor histidine kinase KdpD
MTAVLRVSGVANATTIALCYLLVVLFVASLAKLWIAVVSSLAATLCLNFFFLPPVGTFALVDPSNWAALATFVVVSVVAGELSASARAKAQEALDRRNELLEERHAAELSRQRAELSSALFASLSHDLRTPLTAIRTAVSNLDSPDLGEDQRRDQSRVASDQVDRLTRLFDEILDMARIDAGSVRALRTWTTPAEIVEAAVAHADSSLGGRDVRVDARDDVAVEIDPRLASSALAHLLENAAQYAQQGPIAVRGWINDEGLRLEVRDEGPGLQVAELERLFEPFYRGELLRRQVPGTGMGLAITRGLLAADAGRVWAENAAPHGACFHIAVPARTRPLAAPE